MKRTRRPGVYTAADPNQKGDIMKTTLTPDALRRLAGCPERITWTPVRAVRLTLWVQPESLHPLQHPAGATSGESNE